MSLSENRVPLFRDMRALLHQLPFAVDELHQHQRPLVDAEAIARLEVVDAVGADHVLGGDQSIP